VSTIDGVKEIRIDALMNGDDEGEGVGAETHSVRHRNTLLLHSDIQRGIVHLVITSTAEFDPQIIYTIIELI
jgi:hypothetical protein